MPYKVRVPDMRYGGRTYLKGEPIEPVSAKDAKLLKAFRKIEDGEPDRMPVRKADTPRPPIKATKPTKPKASATAPKGKPAMAALSTTDAAPLVPTSNRYLNRRLKTED